MQDSSVKRLFIEKYKYYSRRDQSSTISPIINLFLTWVKNKKGKISIAEFGGSAGQLLNEISKRKSNLLLANIELIDEYKNKQINKNIKFIKSSLIENKIKKNSYDAIIIRDVLHHLVGNNLKSTKKNQEKALIELKRIVKPNGAIFIEELVEESFLISLMLYLLLKLNSLLKIRIDKIDLSPNAKVFFMTKKNLLNCIKKIFKEYDVKIKYNRSDDKYQKLGHLGSNSGKLIILIK